MRIEDFYDITTLTEEDLLLTPTSRLHAALVSKLLQISDVGLNANRRLLSKWKEVEECLDVYMPADEIDKIRKSKDRRRPTTIVIPVLAQLREVFLTAMHRIFTSTPTIHFYKGDGSAEREAKAVLAQKIIQYHSQWFKERRVLDKLWGDAFVYGRGYAYGKWRVVKKPEYQTFTIDEITAQVSQLPPGTDVRMLSGDYIAWEGTEWVNLNPYNVIIDPEVTPDNFQDSEFFGWIDLVDISNESDLLDEGYMNIEYMRYSNIGGGAVRLMMENQYRSVESQNRYMQSSKREVINLFVRMNFQNIPLWMFSICNNTIVRALPVLYRHGGIPVVCCAPTARSHEITPISMSMLNLGMQQAVSYLVKRRLDNIDLLLNGRYVVDPEIIEWKDFKESTPGAPMIIRKRPSHIPVDISRAIFPINSPDVTAQHWNDISLLINLIQESSGINELVTGTFKGLPERPTAVGIQALQNSALSRLGRLALIIDEQCHVEMGYQMLCNATQFGEMEFNVKLLGDELDIVGAYYNVSPDGMMRLQSIELDPNLEVLPILKTSDYGRNIPAMTQIATVLMQSPEILMNVLGQEGLFKFIQQYFRTIGLEEINYINPPQQQVQAVPQQVLSNVQQQVQQGNIVPLQQAQEELV